MKILRVEAEVFHADRRRDGHDEVNKRFWQFCESASKWYIKLNTKQMTPRHRQRERERETERERERQREREKERERERQREMTETELLIANIKYRGRLINEAFLEL